MGIIIVVKNRFKVFLIGLLFCNLLSLFVSSVKASEPVGAVDLVTADKILGWAEDEDFNGPTKVHVYIDQQFWGEAVADEYRGDIGEHGFTFEYPPVGSGQHELVVYVIGVNENGVADGQNVPLQNTTQVISNGCIGLQGAALEWCENNPDYWVSRQEDTKIIGNDFVKIGINNSYGGMISQLYSNDMSYNLIDEHGGGAIQLSLYGYDLSAGESGAWFGSGGECDPVAYASEAACLSANPRCREFGAGQGSHVADCQTVRPCNGKSVGWPYNPIQAQGYQCTWESQTNDVDAKQELEDGSYQIVLDNPGQFSKSAPFDSLEFKQTVLVEEAYAQIDYQLNYTGGLILGVHEQELPAVFTNNKLGAYYYYYTGDMPFENQPITKSALSEGEHFVDIFAKNSPDALASADEYWWGVCDQKESTCLTIATFSHEIEKAYLKKFSAEELGAGGSYLAPIGNFAIKPGLSKKFRIFLFPYHVEAEVKNKTVRQWIYELAEKESICSFCDTGTRKNKGNADCNERINTLDFSYWKRVYEDQRNSADVDFNCDQKSILNKVDLKDLEIWLKNY